MILRSRVFVAQLVIFFLVAAADIIALSFDLYWRYIWLDVPVHFLAGVWSALVLLWFASIFRIKVRVLPILLLALLIVFGWEGLEILIGRVSIAESNYLLDTSIDLLAGFTGAVAGYGFGKRILKA